MLPEEAQALMAKVLLVVFGTMILCFSKVRASEGGHQKLSNSGYLSISAIATRL